MIRFRTRYFNDFVERGIADGARQVVVLGSGFDMRAHVFAHAGAAFYGVDQSAVIDYKTGELARHGLEQVPAVRGNYLETDVPGELAALGMDLKAPTLMVWEGNTMYLPPESIMPLLNRLADALPRLRIAFDYFKADLQNRDELTEFAASVVDMVEAALHVTFTCGFPDLGVFERETPLRVADSGTFYERGRLYGHGEIVDAYPEEWREALDTYCYCVLRRG